MARTFKSTLQGVDRSGTSTFMAVPKTVMRDFGERVRVPVRVSLNGVSYRTTICNMGFGPMFGVRKEIRDRAHVSRNDRVTVTIEEDRMERTVAVPAYLRKAMNATDRAAFDAMSFTYRREHVQWVAAAKRLETRERRIRLLIADVRARARAKKIRPHP